MNIAEFDALAKKVAQHRAAKDLLQFLEHSASTIVQISGRTMPDAMAEDLLRMATEWQDCEVDTIRAELEKAGVMV